MGKYTGIWGVDPGRFNLFTALNDRGQKLRRSMKQFHYDAKYTRSKRVIDCIYQKNPAIKAALDRRPKNKTAYLLRLRDS